MKNQKSMKKILFSLVIAVLVNALSYSQSGSIRETVSSTGKPEATLTEQGVNRLLELKAQSEEQARQQKYCEEERRKDSLAIRKLKNTTASQYATILEAKKYKEQTQKTLATSSELNESLTATVKRLNMKLGLTGGVLGVVIATAAALIIFN